MSLQSQGLSRVFSSSTIQRHQRMVTVKQYKLLRMEHHKRNYLRTVLSGYCTSCPQCFQQPSKKKKKAKWLLEDDHGLPRIEQVPQELNMSSMWLCPTLHCLRYLATALGVDHAVLDSADAFLSITLAAESQDQFAFT